MKKYVFIIVAIFIHTNVYAVNMPWFSRQEKKPVQQKDNAKKAVVEKAKPATPAKAEPAKQAAATTPAEMKELSKEEMVARLKEMVEYHPDLISAIPGLAVKEAEGKKYIEYNGKRLEDLDKETVANIFRAANRYISFKNMQRFQQQMKNLKQIEDMNRMQRQLKRTQTPTTPKTYTPPKTYRAPRK